MLLDHYCGAMPIDFDRVRADDPSVTDPSFVVVAADALPGLEGGNFWWENLPPPGEFKFVFLVSTFLTQSNIQSLLRLLSNS